MTKNLNKYQKDLVKIAWWWHDYRTPNKFPTLKTKEAEWVFMDASLSFKRTRKRHLEIASAILSEV